MCSAFQAVLPTPEPSKRKIRAVLDVHGSSSEGTVHAAERLCREGYSISRHRACGMKSAGPVADSLEKLKQRRWVICERMLQRRAEHRMACREGSAYEGAEPDHLPA